MIGVAPIDEESHAVALSDPDAKPLTPERLARMKRTPQVKVIRRALGLSQEDFAARLSHTARHAPRLGAGAQGSGRRRPRYLVVIGRNPSAVAEALHPAL